MLWREVTAPSPNPFAIGKGHPSPNFTTSAPYIQILARPVRRTQGTKTASRTVSRAQFNRHAAACCLQCLSVCLSDQRDGTVTTYSRRHPQIFAPSHLPPSVGSLFVAGERSLSASPTTPAWSTGNLLNYCRAYTGHTERTKSQLRVLRCSSYFVAVTLFCCRPSSEKC